MKNEKFNGLGKKKTAIARVIICKINGFFTINKKPYKQYFARHALSIWLEKLFQTINISLDKLDIKAKVDGGGEKGQAEAIAYGISKALLKSDHNIRATLRKHKLLTRDSRIVERKKYGQAGARKKFQFSKR